MAQVTLELIHQDLQELKQDILVLKDCVHEDFLELSLVTTKDIEESRQQIKQGKFVSLEEL